ncbi:hypothetical protein MXC99_07540 [Thauera aromatica]|uniref:hypothetical protein n=1 Tax=Thauera aromatica TaxID=59405 RepID=UPI001FFDA9C0|nr:hypothetical protein [Thauera aromatica]MCK2088028.1 hypothetical protein [Thauera aromatica]MCK2127895.1 hypothetical protein [Thauera aromatica]
MSARDAHPVRATAGVRRAPPSPAPTLLGTGLAARLALAAAALATLWLTLLWALR